MSEQPYRTGMATGLGVMLASGLVLGVVDVLHAGGGVGFAPALLGLWAILALPAAIGTGIVLGAGNATWGNGFIRRLFRTLRTDRELDATVSAVLIAAAAFGGVLAFGVAKLSVVIVGNVERKSIGGLLLGVIVIALIPLLGIAAIPLFRIARRVTHVFPAIGPLSRVVLFLAGAVGLLVAVGAYVVLTKLDYQAMSLGSLIMPALLPVVAIVIGLVMYGPLARVRERIPRRGMLAAAAVAIAIVLPTLGLRGTPSVATQTAVTERSYIGGRMIEIMRHYSDHDGDGYSAFFGGPDCDDHNPDIHPLAKDIPGNGIDENCAGGDAPLVPIANGRDHPPDDAGAGSAAPAAISGGSNVLIIFVDTLRADRLGFTGYQRDGKSLTPRLDAFAKQAVVFTHAYSQAPNTPRSVPSFLTSRYPSQIKVDKTFKDYATVLDDNDLLFEALRPAGFTTIGESSHFYFCDEVKRPKDCDYAHPKATNIDQGADLWDNSEAVDIAPSNHDISGPRITKKAIAKLDELAAGKQKFALLVHLFDPHSTYMEHPGWPITEHGEASLAQKYDYEIAFEDGFLGQIFDELDKTGLAATTTVIVMADHGEAFGVHTIAGERLFFHGQSLYQELLHVPLMFRVPGVAPCMAKDVVQLVDLAPTITALFGVPAPASWSGRSLVPAFGCKTGALPAQPAYSEMLPAPEWDHEGKSMITADGKRHVFYRISDNRWEIYDLTADADEKKNIVDTDPDAKQLEAQLSQWIEGALAAGGGK